MEEKKENKEWEVTTNRFVAFFDIMGFKDLVFRKEHSEIVKLLESISKNREALELINNHKAQDGSIETGHTRSYTFSDSIIFFSSGDSKADLTKILLDCALILAFSLDAGIPIKCAISYGQITVNVEKSVFFGQPIIDAYLLNEELLMYTIVLDNLAERKIKELLAEKFSEVFTFYKTPLKAGKINHYLKIPGQRKNLLDAVHKLYEHVAGRPRQYIDNTIEFIESLDKISPR
jgi:hypothetical protein